MRCFFASAVGKDDVDAIYDHCVLPVLKKLSVQALRVDRLEHNEDIDNKIFEFLGKADFVIADLTYARPSVYYEGGYATGKDKPVVYIVRHDHFRARDNDPQDFLRVHFDLQMKNIISWSEADDAFSQRLAKRLRYVLRPLLRDRHKEQQREDECSQFSRLSLDSKIEILGTRARNLLKGRGFSFRRPQPHRGPYPWVLCSRESNGRRQDVAVLCTPSAVKGVFDGVEFRTSMGVGFHGTLPERFHYVIVSLKSVPRSRVTQALSSFRLLEDGSLYLRFESRLLNTAGDVFVHVIGGVKSEPEFTHAFRSILARHTFAAKGS